MERDSFFGLCKCLKTWWPGTELNRRRQPFQGCALPPELPGHCLDHSRHQASSRAALVTLGRRRLSADAVNQNHSLSVRNVLDYSNRYSIAQTPCLSAAQSLRVFITIFTFLRSTSNERFGLLTFCLVGRAIPFTADQNGQAHEVEIMCFAARPCVWLIVRSTSLTLLPSFATIATIPAFAAISSRRRCGCFPAIASTFARRSALCAV